MSYKYIYKIKPYKLKEILRHEVISNTLRFTHQEVTLLVASDAIVQEKIVLHKLSSLQIQGDQPQPLRLVKQLTRLNAEIERCLNQEPLVSDALSNGSTQKNLTVFNQIPLDNPADHRKFKRTLSHLASDL